MSTFTALGDSITVGVGDPVRLDSGSRAWRGWAALLAGALLDAELHNLASNGACAADVEQGSGARRGLGGGTCRGRRGPTGADRRTRPGHAGLTARLGRTAVPEK